MFNLLEVAPNPTITEQFQTTMNSIDFAQGIQIVGIVIGAAAASVVGGILLKKGFDLAIKYIKKIFA